MSEPGNLPPPPSSYENDIKGQIVLFYFLFNHRSTLLKKTAKLSQILVKILVKKLNFFNERVVFKYEAHHQFNLDEFLSFI